MNNWINSPANPSNPTSPMNPNNPNNPINSDNSSSSQAIEFNSWVDYVIAYGFFGVMGLFFIGVLILLIKIAIDLYRI